MYNIESIKEEIKAHHPLLFGDKDSVSSEEFFEAYNSLADYSTKATEPALKSETHKHQWALYGASIGLISLVLFKVGKIKIGESTINVDRQVLIWYAMFLVALLLTFLLRAGLDLKRASLSRIKDSDKLSDLQSLVQLGILKKNIQHYYLLELYYNIDQLYWEYQKTLYPENPTNAQKKLNPFSFDIDSLRKIETLTVFIESHENFLKEVEKHLNRVINRFQSEISVYDSLPKKKSGFLIEFQDDDWDRYNKVEELYKQFLDPWVSAKNQLASEHLKLQFDEKPMRETVMLDAQLALLRKAHRVRQLYALSEIVLPTLLTLFAVGYVGYTILLTERANVPIGSVVSWI